MPSPGGRWPAGPDEGKTIFYKKRMKKKEIITLISQKSEIFASFPQGKPFGASHQQIDKPECNAKKEAV